MKNGLPVGRLLGTRVRELGAHRLTPLESDSSAPFISHLFCPYLKQVFAYCLEYGHSCPFLPPAQMSLVITIARIVTVYIFIVKILSTT